MNREQWCDEFVRIMCESAGFEAFADGRLVADYAREIAPTYCADHFNDPNEPPDACVEADMSFWAEE